MSAMRGKNGSFREATVTGEGCGGRLAASLSDSSGTIVGLGLYWAWTFFSFNQATVLAAPLFVLHIASMLGASLAYALVTLAWRRLAPLHGRRVLLVVCGALSSLTTMLYLIPGMPGIFAVAGAVTSGFFVAPVVCALGERFCGLPVRLMLANTVLFLLLGYAVMLTLSLLVQSGLQLAAAIVVGAIPLLAALAPCGLQGGGRAGRVDAMLGPNASEPDGGLRSPTISCGALRRLPWRTFVVIACMYFAVGGLRVYVESVSGVLEMGSVLLAACIVILVLALVAIYGLVFRGGNTSLAPMYKVAMPLVAVGYLVLVAIGPQIPNLLSSIAHLTCLLCGALCWVLAADSVCRRGLPALPVMGVSRLMVNMGMALGELLGYVCLGAVLPFAIATVLLLVLSFVFLFSDRETSVAFGHGEDGGLFPVASVNSVSTDATPSSSVGSLPPDPLPGGLPLGIEAWGLTERERTVLVLWVTSHGTRAISETLGLSESTVKTHIRHIYEKAGVRNRAELIDGIDAMR